MDRSELLEFMRGHAWAVQASVAPGRSVQAALIGFAVTDDLHIVFQALASTRKLVNLRNNPRIALVIGGWSSGDERTLQYEGVADEPQGEELDRLTAVYRQRFSGGWSTTPWPGWVYVRVRPTWLRYSDYTARPARIVEVTTPDLP